MPANLHVGVFANDAEGALELKNFILANKSPDRQYGDLERLNLGQGDSLPSVIGAINSSWPVAYDAMMDKVNLYLSNGIALLFLGNSEASPRGSTNLGQKFTYQQTVGANGVGLDYILRFEYDGGYHQSMLCTQLVSIVAAKVSVAKEKGTAPCLQFVLTIGDIMHYTDSRGFALFLQPCVALDRSSENYAEYIISSVNTIKQSFQGALDVFPLHPPSAPVPSEIQDTLESPPDTSPSSTAQGARAARGHGSHESSRGRCSIS